MPETFGGRALRVESWFSGKIKSQVIPGTTSGSLRCLLYKANRDKLLNPFGIEVFYPEGLGVIDKAIAESYSPRSLNPGWLSGRRPRGQRYLRSDSEIGRSLMEARRVAINPSSLNSQFSLP